MKVTLEILGTLCVVQAVGGTINNLWGSGRSWFLVNYLDFLDGYEIFAGIVLGVLGLALCSAGMALRRKDRRG
ncbi:hypothetical protein [Streptosporangium carneum]|uniref:Uncharacterized protein n=1 Tax=Streptosporangium carneum TaxID=47481 RepID=A0A9W6I380_9ACTN|nr:hypothetical protein [Streptosporangium carneum]GLK10145.1 hypothetical protein GCM10017600_35510 [Streptosporangium carneum]